MDQKPLSEPGCAPLDPGFRRDDGGILVLRRELTYRVGSNGGKPWAGTAEAAVFDRCWGTDRWHGDPPGIPHKKNARDIIRRIV